MNTHSATERTTAEKIADVIKANSKLLILLSVAVFVLLVLIGVYDTISTSRNEKALIHAENIEEVYQQWINSAEADRESVSEELQTLIDTALDKYDGTYAAMRAYYTKGLISAEEEKWEDSIQAFQKVASEYPGTYLAPTALFNAASIADQSGDTEKALALYESVIKTFGTESTDIPETLFNIARLNEELGNADSAMENYQKIVDEYSSSSWTNIAKSRIISIKANS